MLCCYSKQIEHVAGEVRVDGSCGVGAIHEGRNVVFHPDDLSGSQCYVNGHCTGWCAATGIEKGIKVEVSVLVYEQPEMGTPVITSL